MDSIKNFLSKHVKTKFREGNQVTIAKGRLDSINDGFVKLIGIKATLVINQRNIIDVKE